MGRKAKLGLVLLVIGLGFGAYFAVSTLGTIAGIYEYAADADAPDLDEGREAEGLQRNAFLNLGIAVPLVGAGSCLLLADRWQRRSRRTR